MERHKRGLVFWALMIVAVLVPALTAQTGTTTKTKKTLFTVNIKAPNSTTVNVGGGQLIWISTMTTTSTGTTTKDRFDYMISTWGSGTQGGAVTKVSLVPNVEGPEGPWEVVLCENGQPVGDCTYGDNGQLDLDGSISPLQLYGAGANFQRALGVPVGEWTNLRLMLNNGDLGAGLFKRNI